MARPKQYDDDRLLWSMAELLAWPEYTNVRTKDEAMREAIKLIPGSDRWPSEKHERIVMRLKKAYAKTGAELETASREGPRLIPGPYYPPPLLNMPTDPETAHIRSEAGELVEGLRYVSQWAAFLAAILERQRWQDAVHPDLLVHARALIRMVKKEEERATGEEKNRGS